MIFYLHIPKTGGQTLSIRLASAFAPSRVYMMGSDLNFPRDLSIFNEFLRSKDFVGTHVSGSIPPGEHKIKILVTVRNPIQHLISLYSHIRREPADNLHRAANLLSPQKLLEVFESFFTNFQTRSLVKSLYPLEPIKHMKGIDRWLLDNLYSALDRLHWLIPTDRIDEFTALWSLENGISVPQSTTRVNIAPSRSYARGRMI